MSDAELEVAHFAESCSDDGYGPILRALRTEIICRHRERIAEEAALMYL